VSTGAKDHLLANALACHGNDTIRVFDQMRGYGIRTPGHCTDVRPDDVHVQLKSVRPVHPDEYTKTSGCTGRTRPGVPGVRVRVYRAYASGCTSLSSGRTSVRCPGVPGYAASQTQAAQPSISVTPVRRILNKPQSVDQSTTQVL
jgi:hypothetical protein